jgi:phosphohistidine phosphatase
MKRLYLLRHAKSSWDDAALADRERPLALRGRAAVALLAAHLDSERVAPALVLCSPARRAQETLEGIAAALGEEASLQTERELYGASATDLLQRLRRISETFPSAMLIGHNPALQDLALSLARPDSRLERVEQKYPTGALAVLTVRGRWSELADGSATLVDFVRPKDLR